MKRIVRMLGYKGVSHLSLIAVLLIILSAGLLGCSCDDEETPDASGDGSLGDCEGSDCSVDSGMQDSSTDAGGDSSMDVGSDIDSSTPQVDSGLDSAEERDGETIYCHSHEDCENHVFCDGIERCIFDDDAGGKGICFRAVSGPCADPIDCNEDTHECNCDLNNNGIRSFACGGSDCDDDNDRCGDETHCPDWDCLDCDDQDFERNYGNDEICDDLGKDEDCNPKTIRSLGREEDGKLVGADGDKDGDGHIDIKCFNIGPDGERIGGDDCNDSRDNVKPGVSEVCDGIDNNCDGVTDEDKDGKEFGLRSLFCIDRDRDGAGNAEECDSYCIRPDGWMVYDRNKLDCDDRDKERCPQNDEICDGKDNDCDGETDEPDQDGGLMFDQPSFTNTIVLCNSDAGEYYIPDGGCPPDKLHCSGNINLGCETFATTLSTCRACETKCLFSCGEQGCDEIDKFSVGGFHVCTVTSEGQGACWGRNSDGQLGIDQSGVPGIPAGVVGIPTVKEIATGYFHSCAIAGEENRLYCWGRNEHGQLGEGGQMASSSAPVLTKGILDDPTIMANVRSVAAGNEHTCAVIRDDIFDGRVACWGNQEDGRLGNNEYEEAAISIPIPVFDWYLWDVVNGVQVVAGRSHSCLLTDDGTVMCWGDNTSEQLGVDGEVIDPGLAQEVPGLADLLEEGSEIVSLSAGRFHTCALSSSGKVYCWGNNGSLQLGRPADGNVAVPEEVEGLIDIVAIAAGDLHTCALSASKELMCWGSNEYGERGDDNSDPTHLPQLIEYEEPFDRVAAGRYVTCARTESGQGVCWGNSLYQQLGNDQAPVDFQHIPQNIIALNGSVP